MSLYRRLVIKSHFPHGFLVVLTFKVEKKTMILSEHYHIFRSYLMMFSYKKSKDWTLCYQNSGQPIFINWNSIPPNPTMFWVLIGLFDRMLQQGEKAHLMVWNMKYLHKVIIAPNFLPHQIPERYITIYIHCCALLRIHKQ